MYWANFLHFYQPAHQHPRMVRLATEESYAKIIHLIERHRLRVSINFAPTLLELWQSYGYKRLLQKIAKLVENGLIELVATAKYHAFLPLLPEKEIERQIVLALETGREIFGKLYQPRGFFPPECGYHSKVAKVVANLGFDYLILDEIAYNGRLGQVSYDRIYFYTEFPQLLLHFAERAPSYLGIMRGEFLKSKVWRQYLGGKKDKGEKYIFTATDAEIYGYHRPQQINLLEGLKKVEKRERVEMVLLSELPRFVNKIEAVQPLTSSWSTLPQEMRKGLPYPFWQNPQSHVHRRLSQLQKLTVKIVNQTYHHNSRCNLRARELLDKALASDAFWWGSCYKSWWSPGLIEYGAYLYRKAIEMLQPRNHQVEQRAFEIYKKLILRVWEDEYDETVEKRVKEDLVRMKRFEKKLKKMLE